MNGEVHLIVRPVGVTGVNTLYDQWLNQPINVNTATQKMYAGLAFSPIWNCGETQLLLDYIQAHDGITVNLYDVNDALLGTAFLTTESDTDAGCTFGTQEATFAYETDLPPLQMTKVAYFQWILPVEGKEYYLDLFENESISQNWKFQDLNNFSAQGAFSREFRIPFSDTNQLALGALFDVNVSRGNADYFHYKLPAEIRVDTIPIATGYVRVRKVYKQKGLISEVELAFYAETPDLVRNIGEKKLKDITALPTLNEDISYANVTTTNSTRIWTLCDRGQRWSEAGEAGTRRVSDINAAVFAADLTPALNWKWLFNQIISDAGFELAAGTLENILQDYWMPFCNSQYLNSSSTGNSFLFTAQNSVDIVFPITAPFQRIQFEADTEVFDNNGNYDPTTWTYTAPAHGQYTFGILATITNASPFFGDAAPLNLGVSINGAPLFFPPGSSAINCFGGVGNSTEISVTYTAVLQAGDTVEFYFFSYWIDFALTLKAGSYLSLIGTNLFYGSTIYYPNNAPDIKQIDFITDIIKMHNCAIVSDRQIPNKIYLVPQTSYLGSGNTLDWTGKLDLDKDVTLYTPVELQKGKFQFTYTDGQDYLSQQYKKSNRIYGDYEAVGYTINPTTQPSDFAIGDQKIQLVTQSTPCAPINGTNKIIPQFLNDSQQFVAPGMRCLYDAGTVNIILYDESIITAVLTAVPVLNHYSIVNANIDDFDLNWAPEVPAYAISGNPYNNLFNQYWRSYMNALYSPDARIMEASFALDVADIYNFQFSDKVWIEDSWWRILEVNDYKVGLKESTQVKLLKFLDNVEDCTSRPAVLASDGLIEFVDANDDPVEATQDCCQRYGYNWDEVNGVCWGNVVNGPERPSGAIASRPTRPSTEATPNRTIDNGVIAGTDVIIPVGNNTSLAVGTRLQLDAAVGSTTMLGKNTYTKLPGIHLGGGWKNGLATSTEKGWAQSGIVINHYKDSWTDSQWYDIPIEGITGKHIDMADNCLWSVLMNATILDGVGNYCIGQYSIGMQKIGGFANSTGFTTINEANGTAYTFTFDCDTTTNTDEHRIRLQVTGIGVGSQTFIVTVSLQYQQNLSV